MASAVPGWEPAVGDTEGVEFVGMGMGNDNRVRENTQRNTGSTSWNGKHCKYSAVWEEAKKII
jgi:hypothetical protein